MFPCSEDAAALCNPQSKCLVSNGIQECLRKKKHNPNTPLPQNPLRWSQALDAYTKSDWRTHMWTFQHLVQAQSSGLLCTQPISSPSHPIQPSWAVEAHLLGYRMSSTNVKCKVILTSWSSSKFSRGFFPLQTFSSVDFSIKTHYLKRTFT